MGFQMNTKLKLNFGEYWYPHLKIWENELKIKVVDNHLVHINVNSGQFAVMQCTALDNLPSSNNLNDLRLHETYIFLFITPVHVFIQILS